MSATQAMPSMNRKTLHEEVVERLRDYVVEGDLKPGQKIPEKALCEQLGISRTPLREALKVLASDRLITLVPNRGAVVRELTRADVEEVFPVLAALEALAGELACEQVTDEELETIEGLHTQMVEHYNARELVEYFHCNREIHERILAASRNETLISTHRSLVARLQRARYRSNTSGHRWSDAVAEHTAMLVALQRREGPALGQLMRAHLEEIFAVTVESLEKQAADSKSGNSRASSSQFEQIGD